MESSKKIDELENNYENKTGNFKHDIMEQSKRQHDSFTFYLNHFSDANSERDSFIHDLLGFPRLPIVGKYSKNSYDFSQVISLVTCECKLNSDNPNDQIKEENIKLPFDLIQILKDVENIGVKENNTTCSEGAKNKEGNSNKLLNNNIKFYWIISHNNLVNDSEVYNIVPHNFLFKEINFANEKRLTKFYPITIFENERIKNQSGIKPFIENKNSKFYSNINFNNFRVEYSSTHLMKNSLGFSPNNLKFILNKYFDVVQFYLILIDNFDIHVFYFWVINNDETYSTINNILQNSCNLSELLQKLDFTYGPSSFTNEIKNIFSFN